jgi:UDP-N-acetylglucosamine 2-epimerase (non-hydrolysing)
VKVVTVLGTRPEIIRLSRLIPLLDELCDHTLIHTGQNYDPNLSDVFFEQLGLRAPNLNLRIQGASFGFQVGKIMGRIEGAIEGADRFLVLGDTNSALSAFVAKRMGIPVYHMEAGNRCYDDRVPEEVNRRVIDACSDVLLPYTNRSRDNLLAEGYPARRIHVTGNPIWEVLEFYRAKVRDLANVRSYEEGGPFFLATFHRAENVDNPERLGKIVTALGRLAEAHKTRVLISVHPRTRQRINELLGSAPNRDRLSWLDALPFFEFVWLEQKAQLVLTDSGTVQEECCMFGVPCVTLRDTTERPETIDCGSNVLSGVEPGRVLETAKVALSSCSWDYPAGYHEVDVSDRVAKIVLGGL